MEETTFDPFTTQTISPNEEFPDTGPQPKDSLVYFAFIINVCIDGSLCVFGFFGNFMTILVLHKDKVKTSNGVMLQALAVFDSMFLVYVLLYVVLRSVYPYTGDLKGYYDLNQYIVAIVLPFGWTSQTCGIWLVMIMAIDRYYVVSRPLKATSVCTPKNAKKVVIIMFIAAVLFNAPRWPYYYFKAFSSGPNNSTFVSHISSNIKGWDEEIYRKVYHISFAMIFKFVLPLTILTVLNFRLLMLVRQATSQRKKLTNQNSNKNDSGSTNLTVMMIVVIAVFIVCQLPDFVASIIGAGDFRINPRSYQFYAPVKEMMLVFNSAINFYIYCLFYRRFRETLLIMLGFQSSKTLKRGSVTASTDSTKI